MKNLKLGVLPLSVVACLAIYMQSSPTVRWRILQVEESRSICGGACFDYTDEVDCDPNPKDCGNQICTDIESFEHKCPWNTIGAIEYTETLESCEEQPQEDTDGEFETSTTDMGYCWMQRECQRGGCILGADSKFHCTIVPDYTPEEGGEKPINKCVNEEPNSCPDEGA